MADALVRAALERAADGTALRESLPLGTDLVTDGAAEPDVAAVREALVDALASLVLGRRARRAGRRRPVRPARRPRVPGAAGRGGAAAATPTTSSSCAATWPRPWSRAADGARLVSRAAPVGLGPQDVAAVENLLAAGLDDGVGAGGGPGPPPRRRRGRRDRMTERCATGARRRGDPLVGTAAPARRWLLVEYPVGVAARGAWTAAALADAVGDRLHEAALEVGGRAVLIRRPGPAGRAGPR